MLELKISNNILKNIVKLILSSRLVGLSIKKFHFLNFEKIN